MTETEPGNGRSYVAYASPHYVCSYPLTMRTPGRSDLAFTARDNFGNSRMTTAVVIYDNAAPIVELDVSARPGMTTFVAWHPTDDSPVTAYTVAQVVAGETCDTSTTTITLAGDQTRLELANTGKRFCIRATDSFGNVSGWVSLVPGAETTASFEVVDTLTYSLGGVTAVERNGAAPTQSVTVYSFGDHLSSASLVTTSISGCCQKSDPVRFSLDAPPYMADASRMTGIGR